MRFKLTLIIALIVGPFLVVSNYRETAEKEKIAKEGIATVAVPVAKIEKRGRRGGRTYKLDVKFPDSQGVTRDVQVKVSKEIYDRADTDPALPIKYLKEDPTKVIVVGQPLKSPGMYAVGGGMFLFGAIGTGFFLLRRKA